MEEIRKREAATSRYTPTRSTETRANSSREEVTYGNDGALAAGIALAATMQTFVCTHETSHVGTNMAHRVLNSSTQENVHLIIPRPAGRREEIELVA